MHALRQRMVALAEAGLQAALRLSPVRLGRSRQEAVAQGFRPAPVN